ncbi:MAG: transporter substrate-binding domain-containing protein [Crocinitomicaceae bacterium]
MKKIRFSYTYIAVIFTVIATIIIVSKCEGLINSNNSEDRNSKAIDLSLERIIKRGKLIILAENSTTSYFIYRGKKMGFEYEILKNFANDLGVELEVKVMKNLDDAVQDLNEGKGDILACNYTITKERKKVISFSRPYLRTSQVLVQRKPDNWRRMKTRQWKDSLITDPIELAKKTVHVWKNSIHYTRLVNLMDEIGDTIYIVPESGEVETEDLIEQVSNGEIKYTVVDKDIALVNQRFYDNLDIDLELSLKQQIAFGIAKENIQLKKSIDEWLKVFLKLPLYQFLKHKYFEISEFTNKSQDIYSSKGGGKISPFDAIIKKESKKIGLDWRLISAIIYQESKFTPYLESWAGAYGLMQFMPGTGARFGVYPDSPPEVQIKGGLKYISHIYNMWKNIPDENDRIKFMLASYNAGAGHIIDAQNLTEKYDLNPLVWKDNVDVYIKKLSIPQFYNDNLVKSGAFKGARVVNYVNDVLSRYTEYKTAFPQ